MGPIGPVGWKGLSIISFIQLPFIQYKCYRSRFCLNSILFINPAYMCTSLFSLFQLLIYIINFRDFVSGDVLSGTFCSEHFFRGHFVWDILSGHGVTWVPLFDTKGEDADIATTFPTWWCLG